MDATLSLLNLAGAIALLLWGVHMVQSGVQRAFGSNLRRFLAKTLDNRIKAAAAGLGVTTVLQSSTATGLMIASFASAGFVALVPALAAMLGANVGTTFIVQALSFDVSRASSLLLLAGVVMFRAGSARTRDIGRVSVGLGLMLIALSTLLEIITPYEDVPSLRILMGGIATDRLISIVFGALLAWAAHSSVAVALLVMSFAAKRRRPSQCCVGVDHRGEHWHGAQPPTRRGTGRRCGGTKGRRRKSNHPSCRRGGRHAALVLHRRPSRADRAELLARRCGLPYRVQPRDRARFLTPA